MKAAINEIKELRRIILNDNNVDYLTNDNSIQNLDHNFDNEAVMDTEIETKNRRLPCLSRNFIL